MLTETHTYAIYNSVMILSSRMSYAAVDADDDYCKLSMILSHVKHSLLYKLRPRTVNHLQFALPRTLRYFSIMDSTTLDRTIKSVAVKFERACWQVRLLNQQLDDLELRFKCSTENGNRVYNYNQRIKLCVIEGVRNVYYEYAQRIGDKLDDLRVQAMYTVGSTEGFGTEIEVDMTEE